MYLDVQIIYVCKTGILDFCNQHLRIGSAERKKRNAFKNVYQIPDFTLGIVITTDMITTEADLVRKLLLVLVFVLFSIGSKAS